MAENPALEAAMETYRKAIARLNREAYEDDVNGRPIRAGIKRHRAHLVRRAANDERYDWPPKDLPEQEPPDLHSEVSE